VHRGRRTAIFATLALGAIVVSAASAARAVGFRDDFATLDAGRWVEITRPFGHGMVDAANVDATNGMLQVKLPAGRLDGGEMRSVSLYRFGSFRARMRVADAPSSVTAFFLYKAPDYQSEIDIEIFNDTTRRVMLTTYSGGAQTNTVTKLLPFDATTGFHDYVIEYDTGSVRFLVDGTLIQSWSKGVTKSAMYVYVNAWFPSWLAGERPATDRFTSVDWIEHVGR
jgi:beta-glucanase (GH16 family)